MPDFTLRVATWNVLRPAGKRTAADIVDYLTGQLRAHSLDVVALQEIAACRAALRKIPGYTLIEFDDRSGGDNAILVRSTLEHDAGAQIQVGGNGFWWVDRVVKTKPAVKSWGRSHVTVLVAGCRFTTVHLPPAIDFRKGEVLGPEQRAGVYALQLHQLDQHLAADNRPHVALGDWNEGSADNGALSPGGWARRAGLLLLGGLRIDWAAGRGVTASKPVVVERGTAGNTSDHPFVWWVLTIPAPVTPTPTPAPPVEKPMSRLPSNLPQILRAAGLTVVEEGDWQSRGRPASTGGFNPVGVLCHHTATGKSTSDANVVKLLIGGRSDLPGPLCHLGLSRNGTVHLIAAGRANHAGEAKASGTVAAGDGNVLYIGIEAFNDGVGEPWPAAQYDAYVKLCAVLSEKVTGNSAQTVRGHKETSVTGKVDPRFDMDQFRKRVAAEMATPAPATPSREKPTVNRMMQIQALLKAIIDDPKTTRARRLKCQAASKLLPAA